MRSLIAHVMHGLDWTPTAEVIQLLRAAGSPNSEAARQMMTQHFARGVIERQGVPRNYSWRLVNKDGTAAPPPSPKRKANRQGNSCLTVASLEPAGAYIGPVFDRTASLAASLGVTVDECASLELEVIPRAAARLVDNLHRRFFCERRGVE